MKQFEIKIPGFTIAAQAWGNRHCRPILCLHGKLDNAASFDFLAPLLPNYYIVAIDFPGTGFSSSYPQGVLPSWRNDAFLLFNIIKILGFSEFDIIAHSLGHLAAIALTITRQCVVRKLLLLDILGPRVNFSENRLLSYNHDVDYFLFHINQARQIFPTKDEAITDRMKIGALSFEAARALVNRGTVLGEKGYSWTFDRRLRCFASTLPLEDELMLMFRAINIPVCLIRAEGGITYPQDIFDKRCRAINYLQIHSVPGGHHVHMDDPAQVASIASGFFLTTGI